MLTQVSRLGKSIADAWAAGESDTMRELVHSVFHGTANRLRELAGNRAVPERDTTAVVVCLLTDLGPTDTARRHLAFGVGTGTVLARTDDGWTPTIPARPTASLPFQAGASWFMPLRSNRGDTLVVTGGAATRVFLNPDSGGHFARLWRSNPRDLVEFLWEFSARTTITGEDRTAVCVWDVGE